MNNLFFIELKYNIVYFLKNLKKALEINYYKFLCKIIKVEKNKIVFCVQQGENGINCNPKYIAREIIKQKLPYKIVWLAKEKYLTKDKEFDCVKLVDYDDFNQKIKELASANVWIDNVYKVQEYRKGLIKKKNQLYINTWHGSLGIKKMYYDMENMTYSAEFMKHFHKNMDDCDFLLTNSEWEENVFKSAFKFKGKFKRTGHPRNDIFFEDEKTYKEKIFKKYNIDLNKKIALYIPSFRMSGKSDVYDIDFGKLKQSLKEKFDSDWEILTRFHPVTLVNSKNIEKKSSQIDVSYYPDTQELLTVSDVIISDYSSCMFDFVLTKKPCFIFARDVEEYKHNRGFYYSLDDTPFSVSKNDDELRMNILSFDDEKYQQKCNEFLKEKDALEDGNASKRTVEIIKEFLQDN